MTLASGLFPCWSYIPVSRSNDITLKRQYFINYYVSLLLCMLMWLFERYHVFIFGISIFFLVFIFLLFSSIFRAATVLVKLPSGERRMCTQRATAGFTKMDSWLTRVTSRLNTTRAWNFQALRSWCQAMTGLSFLVIFLERVTTGDLLEFSLMRINESKGRPCFHFWIAIQLFYLVNYFLPIFSVLILPNVAKGTDQCIEQYQINHMTSAPFVYPSLVASKINCCTDITKRWYSSTSDPVHEARKGYSRTTSAALRPSSQWGQIFLSPGQSRGTKTIHNSPALVHTNVIQLKPWRLEWSPGAGSQRQDSQLWRKHRRWRPATGDHLHRDPCTSAEVYLSQATLLENDVHAWTLEMSTRGHRGKWTFVKQISMDLAHGPRRRPRMDIAKVHAQTTHEVGTWSARGPHVKKTKISNKKNN